VPARIECVSEVRFPVSVVRVTGTLDLRGSGALQEFLLGCLTDQPAALVVDLSGLSVADDLALTPLPTVARHAAQWPGAELLLCRASPGIARALDRAGVNLRVCRDRQEALAVAASRPAPRRLRQHLPVSVDAPRQARDLIARAATTWRLPPEPTQIAQVIATELVTNAVWHARTPMEVSVVLRDGLLRMAVCDGHPSPPRRQTIMADRADHGRGLQLVDGLAAAWGWVPIPGGKVVWASVRTG
jgi:anti-anti-sigma regulatory factor/anti-sigma regulatory factor (Ser/Thr protein kinase)